MGHVLDTAASLDPARIVVVVRHERERVAETVTELAPGVVVVDQDEVPGTGRAVEAALGALDDFDGDVLVLSALRESEGAAIRVGEEEMISSMRDLEKFEGVSASSESGAALNALRVIANEGRVKPNETVVVINQAGETRYLDVLEPAR